jgi:hypothetical protein
MNDLVLNLISREEWHAREAKLGINNLELPVQNVIIHHGADSGDEIQDTKEKCIKKIRYYQDFHMDERSFFLTK